MLCCPLFTLHINALQLLRAVCCNTFNNIACSILQLTNCVWKVFYNIWTFLNCVKILIIAGFSRTRSYLHPKGHWTAFLSRWGLRWWVRLLNQSGTLCVQGSDLLSCACRDCLASPTGLSRLHVRVKSRLGGFSPKGYPSALHYWEGVRGIEGRGSQEWIFRSAEAWVLTHFPE